MRIVSGALHAFTASYSSWESSPQNVPCRGILREWPRRPSQAWRTFLANQFGQFTSISQVMSPCASGDNVVDASVAPLRSTPLADRLSASSQCVLVDWCDSVRCTVTGARIAQDHVRDRIGMRRGSGRAPPTNAFADDSRARCADRESATRTGPPTVYSCRFARRERPESTSTTVIVRREVLRLVPGRHVGVVIRGRLEYWRTTADQFLESCFVTVVIRGSQRPHARP